MIDLIRSMDAAADVLCAGREDRAGLQDDIATIMETIGDRGTAAVHREKARAIRATDA
ncbi:MAG: hypothetical protein HC888_06650 [Candidatus Competibacteraceae bacterium]|nr:hypothetical protein [Candidatus Competibacteraceae bacterium]